MKVCVLYLVASLVFTGVVDSTPVVDCLSPIIPPDDDQGCGTLTQVDAGDFSERVIKPKLEWIFGNMSYVFNNSHLSDISVRRLVYIAIACTPITSWFMFMRRKAILGTQMEGQTQLMN